jgi:hypothetical protein
MRGRRRIQPPLSPLLALVGAVLGVAVGIAINLATGGFHPAAWLAVVVLTTAFGVVAWQQAVHGSATDPRSLLGWLVHPPSTVELDRARGELLGKARRRIDETLNRSLPEVVRVDLGLAERPGAVEHPVGDAATPAR